MIRSSSRKRDAAKERYDSKVSWVSAFAGMSGSKQRILRRRLAQKPCERFCLLAAGGEILGKALVELRGSVVEIARRRIVADKTSDLLHFGDPAIGFGRHHAELALEPGQHLFLARLQLRHQSI